eukprot:s648_g25.t1
MRLRSFGLPKRRRARPPHHAAMQPFLARTICLDGPCDHALKTRCQARRYCVDHTNASLGGSTFLSLDDNRLQADDRQLRALNLVFNGTEVTLPFVCPALVHEVPALLPQPWHVKPSLDGMYRLVICTNYVFINAGINVKHWAPERHKNPSQFRTQYVPFAFAIAHVEAEECYSRLSEAFLAIAFASKAGFEKAHIGQWHGDLHRGLENARQAVVPNAVRHTAAE